MNVLADIPSEATVFNKDYIYTDIVSHRVDDDDEVIISKYSARKTAILSDDDDDGGTENISLSQEKSDKYKQNKLGNHDINSLTEEDSSVSNDIFLSRSSRRIVMTNDSDDEDVDSEQMNLNTENVENNTNVLVSSTAHEIYTQDFDGSIKTIVANEKLFDKETNKMISLDDSVGTQANLNASFESNNLDLDDSNHYDVPNNVCQDYKSTKTKRKPSKKVDASQNIHSETQRIIRESKFSLPYHKAKQRTLTEFLERKKPVYAKHSSLKMSMKNAEILKRIMEKKEEAEAFYKSDSEGSNDVDDPDWTLSDEVKEIHSPETEINKEDECSADSEILSSTQNDVSEKPISNEGGDDNGFTNNEYVSKMDIELKNEKNDVFGDALFNDSEKKESYLLTVDISETKISNTLPDTDQECKESNFYDTESVSNNISSCPVPNDKNDDGSAFETLEGPEEGLNESSNDQDTPVTLSIKNAMLKFNNILQSTPRLKAQSDVIDLDCDFKTPQNSGNVDELIERFLKHSSSKKSTKDNKIDLSIVSKQTDAEGKENLCYSKIHLNLMDDNDDDKSFNKTPGAQYSALKLSLQSKIRVQRERERLRREKEKQFMESEVLVEDSETYSVLPAEEEFFEESDEETESEPEENDIILVDKKKEKNMFVDDEADEDSANEDQAANQMNCLSGAEEDDKNDSSDSDAEIELSAKKMVIVDDDSDEEALNLHFDDSQDPFSNPPPTKNNLEQFIGSKTESCSKNSFTEKDESANTSTELFGCIPGHQPTPVDKKVNSSCSEAEHDDSLHLSMADSKKNLESQDLYSISTLSPITTPRLQLSLIEDSELIRNGSDLALNLCLDTESQQNTQELLGFCSGEFTDEEDSVDGKSLASYDSDEELVQKKFTGFKDNSKSGIRAEFLENEAELSGSDVSSSDEEEPSESEDIIEQEAADLEVYDEEELREQVGKVHMKKLLDSDKHQIRLLQEMYFEDGDLHGEGRQRKFRWKNIDNYESIDKQPSDVENEENDDDENADWRKQRFEREKFMQEQKLKGQEKEEPFHFGKLPLIRSASLNPHSDQCSDTVDNAKETDIFVQSRSLNFSRVGSFLSRDKTSLTRIADMTRDHSTVGGGINQGGNFVFQTLTEKEQTQKPKVRTYNGNPAKKPKIDRKFVSLDEDSQFKSIFKHL